MLPAEPLDYERQKSLARNPDASVRADLAARADVEPEILFFLAADTAPEVRRRLAENPALPGQADVLLAEDADEAVRHRLVHKAVARLPDNGEEPGAPLERFLLQVLQVLARDASPAVRALLARSVQDRDHAPQAAVRMLAGDPDIAVAEPVLSRSPQLSEEDLLAVARSGPIPGALAAMARRPAVSGTLADAIARSDDIEAIATLLGNPCAQIREETLDQLLERAPDHPTWHKPLVHRPGLPAAAIRILSRFVAIGLVEVLNGRHDLDRETAEAVAETLRRRLDEAGPTASASMPSRSSAGPARPSPPARPSVRDAGTPATVPDQAAERARALAARGALGEPEIDEALMDGDHGFVLGGLAALSGLPEETVRRMLAARSARAVVALAWKAGLSMRLAIKLQAQLARIPPKGMLHAREGRHFPLSPAELAWQLEFFGAA